MTLIIFDLDGTLIDSAADIASSVNELREHFSCEPLPRAEIESYVGNGIHTLIERALPSTPAARLPGTIERYRTIYRRRLLEQTRAYPGVTAALEELRNDTDCTLAVLTNKPIRESEMILNGLDLEKYFAAIFGGDSFERKKPDPMGVHKILEATDSTPERALFVGDSPVDLETAHNASMRSCLVSYGIDKRRHPEIEPDFVVDDLRELSAIVEGLA